MVKYAVPNPLYAAMTMFYLINQTWMPDFNEILEKCIDANLWKFWIEYYWCDK